MRTLSSPVPNAALRLAPARVRAVRRHWMAGSVGLHLVLGTAIATVVTHARLPDPPPSLEVELAVAAAPPPAEAQTTAANVPAAPLPTEAMPDPPAVPDPPPAMAKAPPPAAVDPPVPAAPTPLPPPPQPAQEMASLETPPPPPPPAPPEPATPIVTPVPPPPPEAKPLPRPTPSVRSTPAPHREAAARPLSVPPAVTGAPAKPAESAAPAAPQPGWERLLASWLTLHRTYPEAARRRGDVGDVTLRLIIGPDGRVSEVTIVASTASRELSDAAVAVFTGAVLPPPQVSVVRTIRLRYRLED